MKFEDLFKINVSEHIENKNGLNYLSWAWAWAEFKKNCPDATYRIMTFDGLPYAYDEKTGYMVYTEITANGETQMMWLPVMDSANNAMKSEEYTIKTKYKEIPVKAATMFDINKTIMRCLTKNMAMFGLGLYIYAGEDLPDDIEETVVQPQPTPKPAPAPKKMTPPKAEDKYFCAVCGEPLKGEKINGKDYTAEQMARACQKKYGEYLCTKHRDERENGKEIVV